MDIDEIVRETADTVRNLPVLSGTAVLEMDVGDVVSAIGNEIAKTTRCVLVRWNGFKPTKQGNGSLIGNASIVAHVYETPDVSRAKEGSPHLLDMAAAIAHALHGASAEGMSVPLFVDDITPVEERDDGMITCAVVLRAVGDL